jgi:hypothetical protein
MGNANPFTINPIKKKKNFVGRKDLIDEVTNMLSKQQSCHIVGERKSGKTSFLYRMAEEFMRRKDTEFVYLDMQLVPYGPEELLGRIAHDIDGSQSSKEMDYAEFESFISDKRVILAFDEISASMGNEKIDNDFFEFLRAISSNFEIAYLTTHREKLYNITKDHPTFSSPFFNYSINFDIGYFTEKESEELIKKGGKEFFNDYRDWIIERAHYHPFLLQLICLILYGYQRKSNEDRKPILPSVEEMAYRTLEDHFKYWYYNSSQKEQRVLKTISEKKNTSIEEESIVSYLEKRLLVYRKKDRCYLVSPFFKRIIEREKKEEEPEETPLSPLSQYYWIILLFLAFGALVSYRMEEPIFFLSYIGLIILIPMGRVYRVMKKKVLNWRHQDD